MLVKSQKGSGELKTSMPHANGSNEEEEPIYESDWAGTVHVLFDYGLSTGQIDFIHNNIMPGSFQHVDDVLVYKGFNQIYYTTQLQPGDGNDVLKKYEIRMKEMAEDVPRENRRRDAA